MTDADATSSAHPVVTFARYSRCMQTMLTNDRSSLILEGLWDQLEIAIAPLRSSDEQPAATHLALSRIIRYRIRLREVIEAVQRDTESAAATRRHLSTALIDVLSLLDAVETEPQSDWLGILYEAQDAVLASLHDLRTSLAPGRSLGNRLSLVDSTAAL